MADYFSVFTSSTSRDLEPYRERLIDLIIRAKMHPVAMEHFNASANNALQVCYNALCGADLFVGVYAYRYGYAPPASVFYTKQDGSRHAGDGVTSITEWEYRWAVERGLPLLLFVVRDNAAWKMMDVETGDSAERLKRFKEELCQKHVVKFFDNLEQFALEAALELSKAARDLEVAKLAREALIKPTPAQVRAAETSALRAGALPPTPSLREIPRVLGKPPKVFDDGAFHDRAQEQAHIANALKARKPLVSIYGRGGIGKTALACKALGDFARDGDYGGIAYFKVDETAGFGLDTVLEAFLRFLPDDERLGAALKDPALPVKQKVNALLAAVGTRHYVMLLDNLETLQDETTHMRSKTRACAPSSKPCWSDKGAT